MRFRLLMPLAFVVLPALATNFTYNQTITLTPPFTSVGNVAIVTLLPNLPAISLQGGDSLSGSLTFTTPVHVTGPAGFVNGMAAVGFFSSSFPTMTYSSTITLNGLVINQFPAANPSGPVNSSGSAIDDSVFSNGGAFDFSVTGLSYSIVFSSITLSGQPVSATLDAGQVEFQGSAIAFDTATVPEPGSLALCGLGVVCLGILRRQGNS